MINQAWAKVVDDLYLADEGPVTLREQRIRGTMVREGCSHTEAEVKLEAWYDEQDRRDKEGESQ